MNKENQIKYEYVSIVQEHYKSTKTSKHNEKMCKYLHMYIDLMLMTVLCILCSIEIILIMCVFNKIEPECRSEAALRMIRPVGFQLDVNLSLCDSTIPISEEYTLEMYEDEIFSDSLEYLACCVEAEAGNQTELGKRLVCDVILNRFYTGEYNSLYDVINEDGQFSVVSNGSIYTVTPSEETYRIVREEVENRTNTDVLYFRTEQYHSFGEPLFQEDDHYFSK